MRTFLRNAPIKRKLTILTMLTTGLALLLAGASFLIYEQVSFHTSMVTELITTARMTGANSSAALSFDDPESATQTLHSFSANPHVIAAFIYDKDGQIFARYDRPGAKGPVAVPSVEHATHHFANEALELFQDITLSGEKIGTLYIRHDLTELANRIARYAMILVIVLLAATGVSMLLMQRLQRVITRPVLNLAGVIGEVARDRNYALRAEKHGRDELGQLTDGFNEMLGQIQVRDRALQDGHGSLERRVRERTKELQDEIMERRRTEDERDRFFTLSLDLLCILGFDGYFKRLNPAFAALLGYRDEELMAQPFIELVHPEDRSAALEELKELAAGKTILNTEIRCRCQDGSYRWIAWSATPVTGENIYYAYGRDVTERKQADAEMTRLNRDLMDFSRQAGMAEVATSVLHNVGNVLNSVNVSCSVITEKMRKSRIRSVAQTAEILRTHAGDLPAFFASNETGKKLPEFLTKLAQRLADDQVAILDEVGLLGTNIEHIKEIVSVQQAYAKNPGGLRETLPVATLVEDALRMNSAALTRHHVEVERDYRDAPPVCLEKHSVLQILLNLVSNAKHAVTDNEHGNKRLLVRVAQNDDHVLVSLSDNGVGISPEDMTRIFSHGFTTKKDGHGFGLHSGILAAKEMGGRLTAASNGLGQGATFTLELPLTRTGTSTPHAL